VFKKQNIMESNTKTIITVEAITPIETVWKNGLRLKILLCGMLLLRIGIRLGLRNDLLMENLFQDEAKDGSAGFDFRGKYEEVQANKLHILRMTEESIIFTKME
jgi:hypothetical protein